MILAKSRLPTAPARELSSSRKTDTKSLRGATVRATTAEEPKHVEISFLLPLQEGMELIKTLKQSENTDASPILLWAGRKGEVDIIIRERNAEMPGDTGGKTLVSARAQCRLPEGAPSARAEMGLIEIQNLVINPGRHEVLVEGKAIPQLTYTEFGILHFLASHAGWVFSRQQIVEGVKGRDYPVTDRAVDVQVAGLRKKLGAAADCVQTVRGVGYRFRD
jgi:two-component system alkaline phosphatase synthesis response regulator PhoP